MTKPITKAQVNHSRNCGQTTPVDQFSANPWGMYDMHGNVWEWCQNVWHDNYEGAPNDGSPWVTGGQTEKRIFRGGSWDDNPGLCRSASRYYSFISDYRFNLGFRVVCSAPRT